MYYKASLGKQYRIDRIIDPESGKTVIVPIDDSLIYGPFGGLANIPKKLKQIVKGKPNAVLSFFGIFRNNSVLFKGISGIMNVTASTVNSFHTRKVLVGNVKQAVQMGMDAVAVHLNLTSKYEPEMLQNIGIISRECEEYGMPLMAIVYPRKETNGIDENYEEMKMKNRKKYTRLVAHACRVGVDLGADIVKTQFTGDAETFKKVVEACLPVPVVIAGGPLIEPIKMFQNAYEAVTVGGAGVSFGRNVFNRANSTAFIKALRQIVHNGLDPKAALKILNR